MRISAITFLIVAAAAATVSGTTTWGAGHASATSPAASKVRLAGLWDKPNQACIAHCETFVRSGCFEEMAKKYPASDAASLQERCDDDFSTCLYQCMCENCKNSDDKKDN